MMRYDVVADSTGPAIHVRRYQGLEVSEVSPPGTVVTLTVRPLGEPAARVRLEHLRNVHAASYCNFRLDQAT